MAGRESATLLSDDDRAVNKCMLQRTASEHAIVQS